MKSNRFPRGWNDQRVQDLIAHYEGQTDAEAIAEDEAALDDRNNVVMLVPRRLVPAVRKLLASSTAKARGSAHRSVKRRAA